MGPAILISPLLALMRNQIVAAERMGVRAVTINSENQSAWQAVETQLARNELGPNLTVSRGELGSAAWNWRTPCWRTG